MTKTYPHWTEGGAFHNLREVGPNLYVGALTARNARQWRYVISCHPALDADQTHGHSKVPFPDGEPIPRSTLQHALDVCLEHRERGEVLIHCQAGFSRSAAIAYAVLRLQDGLSGQQAEQRVFVRYGYPLAATLISASKWVYDKSAVRP